MRESGHLLLEGVPPELDRDGIANDWSDCQGRSRTRPDACLVAGRIEEYGYAARLPGPRAPTRMGL